jgi:hypothetical protein
VVGKYPLLGKCLKLLDKARTEHNPIKKLVYYWAGNMIFVDDEKPCKSAVVLGDGGQ